MKATRAIKGPTTLHAVVWKRAPVFAAGALTDSSFADPGGEARLQSVPQEKLGTSSNNALFRRASWAKLPTNIDLDSAGQLRFALLSRGLTPDAFLIYHSGEYYGTRNGIG